MLVHGGNYRGRDDRMKNPRMKKLKIVFGIPLEILSGSEENSGKGMLSQIRDKRLLSREKMPLSLMVKVTG